MKQTSERKRDYPNGAMKRRSKQKEGGSYKEIAKDFFIFSAMRFC